MLLTKVVQLYETKSSRHSTMIVGRSNTAKSITWKILRNTTSTMKLDGKLGYNLVSEYPINPKALGLGELYGEYNLSTGEWLDGVVSSIMRKTCAGIVNYLLHITKFNKVWNSLELSFKSIWSHEWRVFRRHCSSNGLKFFVKFAICSIDVGANKWWILIRSNIEEWKTI